MSKYMRGLIKRKDWAAVMEIVILLEARALELRKAVEPSGGVGIVSPRPKPQPLLLFCGPLPG